MFLSLPPPPSTRHLCGRHAAGRLILAKRDERGSEVAGLAAVGAAEAAGDVGCRGDAGDGMVDGESMLFVLSLSLLGTGEALRLAAALGTPALGGGFRVRCKGTPPLRTRAEERKACFESAPSLSRASFDLTKINEN